MAADAPAATLGYKDSAIRGAQMMRFSLPYGVFCWICLGLGLVCALPALAANYQFLAAPERDLNRIYRLDRATGEVGACQYGLKEGTIGVTLCYQPGEGAGPQASS